MTNAERIHSMTDKELSDFLEDVIRISTEIGLKDFNWLLWLQQEVIDA